EDRRILGTFGAERARHHAAPDGPAAERTEYERGADAGERKQPRDQIAERREHALPDRRLEDDHREDNLEPESPRDGRPVDGAAVGRAGHGNRQDHGGAEQRLNESGHQRTSPTTSDAAAGRWSPMAIACRAS